MHMAPQQAVGIVLEHRTARDDLLTFASRVPTRSRRLVKPTRPRQPR
jgi:hypothetical protein